MEYHEQIGNLFYYELSVNRNEVSDVRTDNLRVQHERTPQ